MRRFKTILLLFFPFITFSQQLTLVAAIDTGLKNRLELKNQKLAIEITSALDDKIKAQWQPQINAQADLRWNTQLQTTLLPFDITGSNPGGTSLVKFGLPFTNLLSLQADQKIFDANKSIDKEINQNELSRQKLLLEQQQNLIKENITAAYYQAILDQEKLKINQESMTRAAEALADARVKFDNGILLENDYNRFELDVRNARLSYDRAAKDLESSLLSLNYQMGISGDDLPELSDDLESIEKRTELLVYQPNPENLPELQIEKQTAELYQLNQKKALAANKPVLGAYANYSVLQLNRKFNPFSADTWFPYNFLGIKLTVPIYNGKLAKTAIRENSIQYEISNNRQELLKQDAAFQSEVALKKINQARLDKEQAKGSIELARKIYETDKFRFENGVITLNDLQASAFTLQQSELNLFNAIYAYLAADLQYRKAFALF